MQLAQLPVEHGAASANAAPAVLDALDCLRVAVTVFDSQERLTYANAHYNYLLRSLPPLPALLGKTYAELIALEIAGGEVKLETDAAAFIAMRRGQLHASDFAPCDITLTDGRIVEVKTRRTKDGGWIGLWTDATQARAFVGRIEHKLAKTESEVKKQAMYLADLTKRLDEASSEADTAKTTLLRTMSHELKTPLNAILGFADLMRSAAPKLSAEQIGEYSGLIHLAGGNLLRLINQILDLTKIAAGRFPLNSIALPAATILHDAMDTYAAQADARNIALTLGDCAGEALADEAALICMVRNLVENAVTFTQPGGHVTLSSVCENGIVRIAIVDNGPGVAAADLLRITEPFEQAQRGMADRPDGAGLGLPLVKALAELHGGRLVLESSPGEGFAATLELPAA